VFPAAAVTGNYKQIHASIYGRYLKSTIIAGKIVTGKIAVANPISIWNAKQHTQLTLSHRHFQRFI